MRYAAISFVVAAAVFFMPAFFNIIFPCYFLHLAGKILDADLVLPDSSCFCSLICCICCCYHTGICSLCITAAFTLWVCPAAATEIPLQGQVQFQGCLTLGISQVLSVAVF